MRTVAPSSGAGVHPGAVPPSAAGLQRPDARAPTRTVSRASRADARTGGAGAEGPGFHGESATSDSPTTKARQAITAATTVIRSVARRAFTSATITPGPEKRFPTGLVAPGKRR